MRMSRLLVRTLREAPADAEVASHQLLVRAGYIRRLVSGVYTFLPLASGSSTGIEPIIREELDAAGCQELLLPVLHPLELWEQSGRAACSGATPCRPCTVEGRGGSFVLGPTHEEVVTATVGAEVDSYRQLPLTVYQIQVKFRVEARPRFGLLRTRELIMADAYSFDVDQQAMQGSYRVRLRRLPADLRRAGPRRLSGRGLLGGHRRRCEPRVHGPLRGRGGPLRRRRSCGYAANVEAAARAASMDPSAPGPGAPAPGRAPYAGPAGHRVVVDFFDDPRGAGVVLPKCLAIFDDEARPCPSCPPATARPACRSGWRLFDDDDFAAHPSLVKGYIGPIGHQAPGITVAADGGVGRPGPWITGANRIDHHVPGILLGRDFTPDRWGSFAEVVTGDACPRCGHAVELVRSVEAAHTFQLGTSTPMSCRVRLRGRGRRPRPLLHGLLRHGGQPPAGRGRRGAPRRAGPGLAAELAPYQVHLAALGAGRSPEVAEAADALYDRLAASGHRGPRPRPGRLPGDQVRRCRLLGIPVRLVVGAKGVARGVVEWRSRDTGEEREADPERSGGGPGGLRPRPAPGAARRRRVGRPGRHGGPPGQGPTRRRAVAAILFSLPFGWGEVTLMEAWADSPRFCFGPETPRPERAAAGRDQQAPRHADRRTPRPTTTEHRRGGSADGRGSLRRAPAGGGRGRPRTGRRGAASPACSR